MDSRQEMYKITDEARVQLEDAQYAMKKAKAKAKEALKANGVKSLLEHAMSEGELDERAIRYIVSDLVTAAMELAGM